MEYTLKHHVWPVYGYRNLGLLLINEKVDVVEKYYILDNLNKQDLFNLLEESDPENLRKITAFIKEYAGEYMKKYHHLPFGMLKMRATKKKKKSK
jgi:hypothetical protein